VRRFLIAAAVIVTVFVVSTAAYSTELTHKVRRGENLYTIGKKYGVSSDQLKSLNGLNSTKLKLGQVLIVKQDSTARKEAKKGKTRRELVVVDDTLSDDEFIEYRVRKGDTLDKLADRFSVEKEEIVEANQLSAKKLKPGRVLLIPKLTEDGDEEYVTLPSSPLKVWRGDEERYMLVKVAKSFMGAPYKFGGESVRGLDCSAYVKKIYDIFDVQLPRSAREQFKVGNQISKEELSVGDLVFFKTKRYVKYPTHVGIYVGEGNFIHASSNRNKMGVKIDSLSSDFYTRTFMGAVRVKKSPDDNQGMSKSFEDFSGNS
jgi:peptidoglycan endopeptidase LytE